MQGIEQHPLEHGHYCGLATLLIDVYPSSRQLPIVPPVGEGLPEHVWEEVQFRAEYSIDTFLCSLASCDSLY